MPPFERRNFAKLGLPQSAPAPVVSPIVERVQACAAKLGLEGTLLAFGSHANSLASASSDCDLTFMPREDVWGDAALKILERFADELPRYGFKSIVRIFQASIPLIKSIDQGGVEVDLCIGNHLGLNNSRLVSAYCQLDSRVGEVCRAVKQWAKSTELVGSSDGHLNSYAYTLLSLYYLMSCSPPVVPNLQELASQGCDPIPVIDRKWGREMTWDCRFWEDLHLLPKSQNKEPTEKLLKGFFRYYVEEFDWSSQAVSVRLALTTQQNIISKFNLGTPVTKEGWYIEDPFDLRHNLAANCVKEGRQRILNLMNKAGKSIQEGGILAFHGHCKRDAIHYLLKCRIHPEKVSFEDFMAAVTAEVKEPFRVHFPLPTGPRAREVADAFLIFHSEASRRSVHTLNETSLGDWQLRLMPSSWALEDAMASGEYKEVPVLPPPSTASSVPSAAAPATASEAALPSVEAASEQVRNGLRAAKQKATNGEKVDVKEVERLIELARTYNLKHEEQMGLKCLKDMQGSEAALQKKNGGGRGSSLAYQ